MLHHTKARKAIGTNRETTAPLTQTKIHEAAVSSTDEGEQSNV